MWALSVLFAAFITEPPFNADTVSHSKIIVTVGTHCSWGVFHSFVALASVDDLQSHNHGYLQTVFTLQQGKIKQNLVKGNQKGWRSISGWWDVFGGAALVGWCQHTRGSVLLSVFTARTRFPQRQGISSWGTHYFIVIWVRYSPQG